MFKNSFPNYGKSAILTDMNILTSLKVIAADEYVCGCYFFGAASAFISEPKPDFSSSAKVIVFEPPL